MDVVAGSSLPQNCIVPQLQHFYEAPFQVDDPKKIRYISCFNFEILKEHTEKMYQILIRFLKFFFKTIQIVFKPKNDLLLENMALRQQLSAYLAKDTKPKLTDFDRSFWVALKQVFNKWIDSLVIVKPQAVIDWQNTRFKKHWTKLSTKNKKPGRKRIKKEIRDLIYRMVGESRWGAPRIYSELLMLGFDKVSELFAI